MSTPSLFIRVRTYRRVELFGSTPSRTNASDSVRAPRAASSSRSLLYALALIGSPPSPATRSQPRTE
ncbi:hypothetical protein GCM10010308_27580 [Streptomyces vinaceusdrappus]|nr:hypothetical protein GCM10010308_27580 [Streptomyces vinaceusdrappus]